MFVVFGFGSSAHGGSASNDLVHVFSGGSAFVNTTASVRGQGIATTAALDDASFALAIQFLGDEDGEGPDAACAFAPRFSLADANAGVAECEGTIDTPAKIDACLSRLVEISEANNISVILVADVTPSACGDPLGCTNGESVTVIPPNLIDDPAQARAALMLFTYTLSFKTDLDRTGTIADIDVPNGVVPESLCAVALDSDIVMQTANEDPCSLPAITQFASQLPTGACTTSTGGEGLSCQDGLCSLAPPSVCGNGIVEATESCEPDLNGSTCPYGQSSCSVCRSDCSGFEPGVPNFCGEGNLDADLGELVAGEACDSGFLNVPETQADCAYGPQSCVLCLDQNASTPCQPISGVAHFCGDGTIDDGKEECDDGNMLDGDGCNSKCSIEACVDPDSDGICSDGDGSGDPADNPCRAGATENCDDNCDRSNPDQADADGDGVGDGCDQCTAVDGMADNDGNGAPDAADDRLDSDGNGIPDCRECDPDLTTGLGSLGRVYDGVGAVPHLDIQRCGAEGALSFVLQDLSRRASNANLAGHFHGGAMAPGRFLGVQIDAGGFVTHASSDFELNDPNEMHAVDAQIANQLIYDVLLDPSVAPVLNGYDNQGSTMTMILDVAGLGDSPAFDTANRLLELPAIGVAGTARGFAAAIDVMAHEYTHAIVQFAGSSRGPGVGISAGAGTDSFSVEEGFCDLIGRHLEAELSVAGRIPGRTSGDGLFGEDAFAGAGRVRDLDHPKAPHRLALICEPFGVGQLCLAPPDQIGAVNKAFSLLISGSDGAFPSKAIQEAGGFNAPAFEVAAIGREKTVAVALQANQQEWQQGLTFEDMAGGSVQAAITLGLSEFEIEQVRKAFKAVGFLRDPATVSIHLPSSGGGSVTGVPPLVRVGDTISLVATPDVGFEFVGFEVVTPSGALLLVESAASLLIEGDVEVRVFFRPIGSAGDINQDGRVDAADILLLLRAVRGDRELADEERVRADIAPGDFDAKVDIVDLQQLIQSRAE